jgi:hypothetical protein
MVKGLAAGTVNAVLAVAAGAELPAAPALAGALLLGFLSYGVSLSLFVVGLRHLGSARTGAYFSTAPFVGAAIGIVALREPVTWQFGIAALLMAVGVWLHLAERHAHSHTHEPVEHVHEHAHDEHHQHAHEYPVTAETRHTHAHSHEPLAHSHAHYPDAHHRHNH